MIEATDYRITVQRRDTEDGRMFEGNSFRFETKPPFEIVISKDGEEIEREEVEEE